MAAIGPGALSTPPATPPPARTTTITTNFQIVPHYHDLLTNDPNLTPPIAAIESLISLLSSSPITTISETLSLISNASTTLLRSQRNPIPVSAGTDLFQRYLITSFQNTPTTRQSDFNQLRNQLITNGKLFVARAKGARQKMAGHALALIRDEAVVVTYGGSRAVGALLTHAAEAGRWFRILQVMPPTPSPSNSISTSNDGDVNADDDRITKQITNLQKAGIEVATMPLSALSYALHSLPTPNTTNGGGGGGGGSGGTMCILGTSAVLENGAAVSEMGCYLVAQVARAHGVPVYVASESYKFARQFPLGYGVADLRRMGTSQAVLNFSSDSDGGVAGDGTTGSGNNDGAEDGDGDGTEIDEQSQNQRQRRDGSDQSVDITPPGLITGLITENGIMTPNAVAEELIKLWF